MKKEILNWLLPGPAALATILCFAGAPTPARAGTVMNTMDGPNPGPPGSLRAVLNAALPNETVSFAAGVTGTITLTGGELDIDKNLVINGPGATNLTIFSANTRVFGIGVSQVGTVVSLSGLRLVGHIHGANGVDGTAQTINGSGGAPAYGGAITNDGILTISDCIFDSCSASGGAGGTGVAGGLIGARGGFGGRGGDATGGAIFSVSSLSVYHCTFMNNSAVGGNGGAGGDGESGGEFTTYGGQAGDAGQADAGAIHMPYSGSLQIINCTFAGNSAVGGAGGKGGDGGTGGPPAAGGGGGAGGNATAGVADYDFGGGTCSFPDCEMVNCTLSQNSCQPGPGGAGGLNNVGIASSPGVDGSGFGGALARWHPPIWNTIIANNYIVGGRLNGGTEVDGGVTSHGNNLVGNTFGSSGWAGTDMTGVDPQLGPLQDNGGPTPTMALPYGSLAINNGAINGFTTDQRGYARPNPSGGFSIGAYEYYGPLFGTQPASGSVSAGDSYPICVTVSNGPPASFQYQWYFNAQPTPFFIGQPIPGATNSCFTITGAQPGESGTYWVVVSSPNGTVTSSPATLTVTPGGGNCLLLNELFNYPPGDLHTASPLLWPVTDGPGDNSNPILVNSGSPGSITLDQSKMAVLTTSLGGTYSAALYASCTVNFSARPSGQGNFVLWFSNPGVMSRGLLYAGPGASPGSFRLGIANGVGPAKYIPRDLQPGVSYFVVVRTDQTANNSTIWIDPAYESTVSDSITPDTVSATDAALGSGPANTLRLRQGNDGSGNGMGVLALSGLRIGTCFADVAQVQMNLWTDNSLSGTWEDPGNWSTGLLPNSAQSVMLNGGQDLSTHVTSLTTGFPGSMTVKHLTIGGPSNPGNILWLQDATHAFPLMVLQRLTVLPGSQVSVTNSTLLYAPDELTGTESPADIEGNFAILGSSLEGHASLTLGSAAHGQLNVLGGTAVVSNSTLNAQLNIQRGALYIGGGSVLVSQLLATNPLGSINFAKGNLDCYNGLNVSNGQPFVVGDGLNAATLRLLSSSPAASSFGNGLSVSPKATVVFKNSTVSGGVVNSGTALSDGANITFLGGFTNNGTLIASNGTTISFNGPFVNNGLLNGINGRFRFYNVYQNNNVVLPVPPCSPGCALSFAGTNSYSYVSVPSSSALNLGSQFTLELWLYQTATNPANGYRLIDKETAGTADGYLLDTYDGVTGRRLRMAFAGNWFSTTPYTLNAWHHAAVSFSSGTLSFYLDGVADGVVTGVPTPAANSLDLRLGAPHVGCSGTCGNVEYFNGLMDEVRIWSVARSQGQIQANMNRSLMGNEAGLVAYWKFDEGLGLTTADFTSHGNAGSLLNSPIWVVSSAPLLPCLQIAPSSGGPVVSWPNPSTGFALQQSGNLADTNAWSVFGGSIDNNGSTLSITVNPPVGDKFYRLKK